MHLHRAERDYYRVHITIDPDLDGVREGSFDNGVSWKDGTAVENDWAWLVAGPDFTPVDQDDAALTQAVIPQSVDPLIRVKDEEISDVQKGPPINLWS